ncbi:MAG: HD domain-containing protein [Nitrospirota bacterium]
MIAADRDSYKTWFAAYCASFAMPDPEDQRNIALKEQHTLQVCKNIVRIACAQSLDETRTLLAETVGLFHDLGRFPQYAQYKTFRDGVSVNHAELGVKILREERLLDRLPPEERELVLTAVKFHNVFKVPALENAEELLFIRLVRDADKLDIWRVFTEYYEARDEDRASAAGLGLPDVPEYSADVLACIFREQLISLAMLKTQADFKLAQMAWVFDLNFDTSFIMLEESNYIRRIAATLPRTDEIERAVVFLLGCIRRKATGGR